jgi:thioredoxin 1
MKNEIIEINYTNFDQNLKEGIVLVDFWAEWCHPCKMQHKLLQELAFENHDFFKIATLNVDDNKVISSKLNVRNIPTLILYKNGEEVRRMIGLQSKAAIINQINNSLTDKKTA